MQWFFFLPNLTNDFLSCNPLIGNSGPEYFYEAQKIVYDRMESKFYAEFVVSHDYTQFVCQSESAMDEIRAHLGKEEEHLPTFDWSDGFNFKERV